MRSGMQSAQLAVPMIFQRAESLFSKKRVYSLEAGYERSISYEQWASRVRSLAAAMDILRIKSGEAVATFCWNTQSHLELYYAVPMSGRVMHPVNVRLFKDEIEFVIRDVGDVAIFVDRSLLESCMSAVDGIDELRHIVVIDDGSDIPIPDDPRILNYEWLLDSCEALEGRFRIEDELDAAVVWHTSGTTGRPKGVVYSHRAVLLHAMSLLTVDSLGIAESDVVMPVVPMFHVGAWGTPYAAIMAGSDFVLVGRDLRGETLARAIERRKVTVSLAVPTVWRSMLPHVEDLDFSRLRLPLCGGSSASAELIGEWHRATGTTMVHAWGMTETGPVATVSKVHSFHRDLSAGDIGSIRTSQGTPAILIDLRVADFETGKVLAHDGVSVGEIQVQGPWVAGQYHNREESRDSFTVDRWLRTGDAGTIDADGYVRLVDRRKDMIKSGGEWISSVDLENAIMAHPLVLEAAVIGVPDPQWDERPLACVVLMPDANIKPDELRAFLSERVARWWLPERIEFVDSIPKTGVGKFSKKTLRETYATRASVTENSTP
jgi:fatty-acyl-CoA synthase